MKPHQSALLSVSASFLLAQASPADPAITGVTAQQHYPWNGKVDIAYTISGGLAAIAKEQALITSLKVTATDQETGTSYTATSLSGDTGLADGMNTLVWDMDAQGLTFVSTNVVFFVSCETMPATYCVIDLSGGTNATSYPVTYLASPPSGGFNVDEYKTTKLVLKRMETGSFMMGSSQNVSVTLTKPFFIGLFEVTQKQYQLVTGSNPSGFSGDKRPVEQVSYSVIRGSSGWPSSNAVGSSSFLGKMRTRTGLDFDLPTEAQWEYACRAGTTTTYSYGDSADGNFMWCSDNSSSQTHEVGTKQPNPLGFYDMHGNVWEFCLDWFANSPGSGTDPKGSSSGNSRVVRGGSWFHDAYACSSSYRVGYTPSATKNFNGFRLSRTFATTSQSTISASSSPVTIGFVDTPAITPVDGTILEGTVSLTMSCATEGATIHYTTDGSEPTADSPVYRRFRVSGRTTVKAVAVKNGLCSEVAIAEYALGQCAAPVITAAASFTGSKTSVALSCATENATIRYTTDGSDPDASATPYTRPFEVTNSCTVKAYATYEGFFDSSVASFAIEKVWGIGDTMGDPDQSFTTGGDAPFVRVTDATAPLGESMKSGAITHEQTSTLSTTVDGPGTVSFQWKTSCEDSGGEYDWDHAEFEVDGNVVEYLDGVSTWQTVSREISGDGPHILLWRYKKDDVESEGEDCCWVADFQWTSAATPAPTATQTTPEPVPYAWLRGYYPEISDEYEAYEAAALATARNGRPVWECYVAGLDPTDETDDFIATIEMVNGEPQISVGGRGERPGRVYTVEGKENLGDQWGPTNATSRFFHIKARVE